MIMYETLDKIHTDKFKAANGRKVWRNGDIINEKDAKVSIFDSALMFGDMCFEMMRTFNKKTFMLHEHIKRLLMSLNMLEIDISHDYGRNDRYIDIYAAHEQLLQWHIENFPEVEEWRSLINVSRGILPLYQNMLNDSGEPNIMIACFPLKDILKGKSHLYVDGVHAIVPSQRAIPHHLLDARLKTRSRQHYQCANIEIARQDKDAWPLLLDDHGFIAESTGSNFFIVGKEGTIATPRGNNCLRGISREFVIDISYGFYDRGCEDDLTLFDVYEAREAFMTCTPYSIVPCTNINGKPIGDGKVGPITKQLQQAWVDSVQCDFIEQVLRWDKE